jgi:hypothetical protein
MTTPEEMMNNTMTTLKYLVNNIRDKRVGMGYHIREDQEQ